MNKSFIKTAIWNLALLALMIVPLVLVLVWLQALVTGSDSARRVAYALEAGGFYYLVYIGGVLAGGLAHQVLLVMLPRTLSKPRVRILAAVLAVIVPLGVITLGERAGTLWEFALPVVLGLAVYALALRLPHRGVEAG